MNPGVFIDANVVMELFFGRRKQQAVLEEIKNTQSGIYGISILSLGTLFYYVEKGKWNKSSTHRFLNEYEILDMNETDYAWAKSNDKGDFEDALQVSCAIRHGCKKILTLDKILAKNHHKHIEIQLIG